MIAPLFVIVKRFYQYLVPIISFIFLIFIGASVSTLKFGWLLCLRFLDSVGLI